MTAKQTIAVRPSGVEATGRAGVADAVRPDESAALERVRRSRARARRRRAAVAFVLVVLVLALCYVDLSYGRRFYAPADVLDALAAGQVSAIRFIIVQVRLPRVLVGLFAGLAFGMAGVSFQRILRNMMASPDIIGITAGANLAAVFGIIVLGLSGPLLASLAVAGGLLTALCVVLLAWKGAFGPTRLILMGIGLAAALNAATSWIMVRANQWDMQAASRWLTGSLGSTTWADVPGLAVALLVAGGGLLALTRHVDALRFGGEIATGLGVRTALVQGAVIVSAVLLLACATASCGPVAFVSFLSGPIAERLSGPSKTAFLPAGLVGGVLMLSADIIAQHLPFAQLPVGVVTSLIGCPMLVMLMIRMNRKQVFG